MLTKTTKSREIPDGFLPPDVPNYDFITKCMHCGLCLPTCPTYALVGSEKSSPRGRIRLIKAVADGDLEISQGFVDEMDFCLDCQACETACPAGVKFGDLIEAARWQIHNEGRETLFTRFLKALFLRTIFTSKRRLKFVARLLRFYQQCGLEWFVRNTGVLNLFSKRLNEIQSLTPRISKEFFDEHVPDELRPLGEQRFKVGFLSGCIMNVAYADVNEDTVEVLRHHHCEVIIPPEQECCGSLAAHNGDIETARKLARRNIDAFISDDLDAIVMNSAGCGAFMKEYGRHLEYDPLYSQKAKIVGSKVKDLSEFLHLTAPTTLQSGFLKASVTYHDPCHLIHAQKIFSEPRELISRIGGIEQVELPESSWCCGSAGIYNISHYEDSMKLLERKMRNVASTSAHILVSSNPGCLAQMSFGAKKFRLDIEVVHLATLLRRAYTRRRDF